MSAGLIRRFFNLLAKMGLSVRDDPPRVVDPNTREWSLAVDDFVLSVCSLPNDDSGAVPAISVALRNVGSLPRTMEIPVWLAFYRTEAPGASLTPYGRSVLEAARNSARQSVTLAPGAIAETQIPVAAIYTLKPGKAIQMTVSCALPGNEDMLTAGVMLNGERHRH